MLTGAAVGSGSDSGADMSEVELAELAQEIADDCLPRVFALVEEVGGRVGAELYAWGVEVGPRASVFTEDGRPFAQCDSAAGAHEMFSLIRRVRLVWPSERSGVDG